MNGGDRKRQMESRVPERWQEETPTGTQDTETPVLSPLLIGLQLGLGAGVLKYSPARRAGAGAGAGPGLPGGGACRRWAGPQLHLQERTIMLDSCSTLALRPT